MRAGVNFNVCPSCFRRISACADSRFDWPARIVLLCRYTWVRESNFNGGSRNYKASNVHPRESQPLCRWQSASLLMEGAVHLNIPSGSLEDLAWSARVDDLRGLFTPVILCGTRVKCPSNTFIHYS